MANPCKAAGLSATLGRMRVELVRIEGGALALGGEDGGPARVVSVAPFGIGPRPVSNLEYARFVAATGAPPAPFLGDERFADAHAPVVGVSWHDAAAYCAWLAREANLPVRLPTTAERELAARGGIEGADWPWGDEPPDQRAELATIAALARPHVPSAACANAFGLACMADNVHEWCSDWAVEGSRRASRGGSWRHRVKFTRVWARSSLAPEFRYDDYGLRIAADDGRGLS